MGIYSNNMGNALGAIQAGINAANARAKAQGDYYRSLGQIWGKVPGEIASYVGRGYDAYQAQQESPEARLQALEAERNEAIYNQQVAQRRRVNDYLMSNHEEIPTFSNPRESGRFVIDGPSLAETYANAMREYRPNDNGYNAYKNTFRGGVYPEIEDYYRRGI